MTQQTIYEDYQERSQEAGERSTQIAWMLILCLAGTLVAGKLYDGFIYAGACALIYMLLHAMQAFYQAVAMWVFKQTGKAKYHEPEDYPDWVGGGAWLFYILKMCAITTGVLCIIVFTF